MLQARQQELKPALPDWQQFLFNFKQNPLTALNPELVNDPVNQKLQELGDFVYPMADPTDPFNQIVTAVAAKTPAGLLALAATRAAKKYKTTKAPAIIKKDEGEELAKQLNREKLAHGSETKNIKTFRAGDKKREATGGTYLTRGLMDPRLLNYIGDSGSVYLIKPSFARTLNTGRLPKDVRKVVEKEIKKTDAPRQDYESLADYLATGGNRYPTQLDKVINPKGKGEMSYIMPPYPTQISAEVADFFNKYGYDSLRFKPTPAFPFKDTIISLNPENTLDILEEIPYEDLLRKIIEASQ